MSVLHPRHKLAYFTKAGWEPDWIDNVWDIIRSEFEASYTNGAEGDGDTEREDLNSEVDVSVLQSYSWLVNNSLH